MLSIQEAGVEILGNNPRSLYFFCGSDYGIKLKYINHLENYYGERANVEFLDDVLSLFARRSLVPVPAKLYVVRYDTEFLSNLNNEYATAILNSKINGTIVCIYEEEKHFNKLNKLFSNNVIRFDAVDSKYVTKYLTEEFKDIPKMYIDLVVKYCSDYRRCQIICNQLSKLKNVSKLSKSDVLELFGLSFESTEDNFRVAIASKNFGKAIKIVESFRGDLSYLYNCICNTMLDLDKAKSNKRSNTIVSEYASKWTFEDIYYMYDNSYKFLSEMRESLDVDMYDGIVMLLSLIRFSRIPTKHEVGIA